jgi:hypothetical protein
VNVICADLVSLIFSRYLRVHCSIFCKWACRFIEATVGFEWVVMIAVSSAYVLKIVLVDARWKVFVTATFWPLHPWECRLVHIVTTHEPRVRSSCCARKCLYSFWTYIFRTTFIFSKSTNLHIIFIYSIGIIFKMRKSVQQFCLNSSTYGSIFSQNNFTVFARPNYSVYHGLKNLSLWLPVDRW